MKINRSRSLRRIATLLAVTVVLIATSHAAGAQSPLPPVEARASQRREPHNLAMRPWPKSQKQAKNKTPLRGSLFLWRWATPSALLGSRPTLLLFASRLIAGFDTTLYKNKTPLRGSLFLWRCGESNPGPLKRQRRHLRAQPSARLSGLGLCRLVSFGLIRSWSFPAGPGSRRGHSCIATPLTGEAGTHRGDELRF